MQKDITVFGTFDSHSEHLSLSSAQPVERSLCRAVRWSTKHYRRNKIDKQMISLNSSICFILSKIGPYNSQYESE